MERDEDSQDLQYRHDGLESRGKVLSAICRGVIWVEVLSLESTGVARRYEIYMWFHFTRTSKASRIRSMVDCVGKSKQVNRRSTPSCGFTAR